MSRWVIFGALCVIGGALISFFIVRSSVAIQKEDADYHIHADFAVFINGKQFDFAQSRYMAIAPCNSDEKHEEETELADVIHLHDGTGSVVHVHRKGVTYADFFKSVQMQLTQQQFVDADGNAFVADDAHQLIFYLNGERIDDLPAREIHDLDRMMVAYETKTVPQSTIQQELGALTSNACFYSGFCSTRNIPNTETCSKAKPKPPLLRLLGL